LGKIGGRTERGVRTVLRIPGISVVVAPALPLGPSLGLPSWTCAERSQVRISVEPPSTQLHTGERSRKKNGSPIDSNYFLAINDAWDSTLRSTMMAGTGSAPRRWSVAQPLGYLKGLDRMVVVKNYT